MRIEGQTERKHEQPRARRQASNEATTSRTARSGRHDGKPHPQGQTARATGTGARAKQPQPATAQPQHPQDTETRASRRIRRDTRRGEQAKPRDDAAKQRGGHGTKEHEQHARHGETPRGPPQATGRTGRENTNRTRAAPPHDKQDGAMGRRADETSRETNEASSRPTTSPTTTRS